MSQRAASEDFSAPVSKKFKREAPQQELCVEKWRVVLPGEFEVKSKSVLEETLKERGAISGKTTHLILGKSGVNECGRKTDVGSSKFKQAQEKKLPIITENAIWNILTRRTAESKAAPKQREANKGSEVKPKKNSSLSEKVVYCIQVASTDKLSSRELLQELEKHFGGKFDSTRSKTLLKRTLTKCVQDGELDKAGSFYKIPDVTEEATSDWTEEDDEVINREQLAKFCPEQGKWRGLRILSTKEASGRAKCGACGRLIQKEKDGQQLQVMDDSLFKMVVWPSDAHEGVSRGYVECCYPGFDVISRKKFFLHPSCKEAAEQQHCNDFHRDWKKVRLFELETRSQY